VSITRYGYRNAISGFFEFPTENAKRLLPPHLEPLEPHHGTSIFSLTAFEFTESMVGPYGEVVASVIVAPLIREGERFPKSAFYPYQVGTTTQAARDHAIERWHLPHWMEDLEVAFSQGGGEITVKVAEGGSPIAEMTIAEHVASPVSHLYQCFMHNGNGSYMANITMEGQQSEHEDERGRLTLFEHPFHQGLVIEDVADLPFRELWMRDGQQLFDPLLRLGSA